MVEVLVTLSVHLDNYIAFVFNCVAYYAFVLRWANKCIYSTIQCNT